MKPRLESSLTHNRSTVMKNAYARVAIVFAVTALCTWFIPGIDDAVEFGFQIAVLVVSSV